MGAWRKHKRFFLALVVGLGVWSATPGLGAEVRLLAGVNGFFASYLVLMLSLAARLTGENLRRHSEIEDEGAALILTLALMAVGFSLTAVFTVLNAEHEIYEVVFALASAPLGWAALHVMATFRYAHLWFSAEPEGGLDFAGATPPDIWDFFYAAFTIGMTAQTSDVSVSSPKLRRMVLLHGLGSFFFNTVILALAVNAALDLSK